MEKENISKVTLNKFNSLLDEITRKGLNKFNTARFYIDIQPKPMARPRSGKFGNIYVPNAQANKKEIRAFLPKDFEIIKTPIKMKLIFYLPYFYGISSLDRLLIDEDLVHHIQKPDIDNLTKTVLDAFNSVIWVDDCIVYKIISEKKFSDHPHIEVVLKWQKEILSNKQKTMMKNRKV